MRENFEFLKEQEQYEDKEKTVISASLLVKQKEIVCVFCKIKGHYSNK